MEEDYGRLEIKLNELIKEKGISENKLCTVLGCEIQDLPVFHPAEKK